MVINYCAGSLPTELGLLTELEQVVLTNNLLTGTWLPARATQPDVIQQPSEQNASASWVPVSRTYSWQKGIFQQKLANSRSLNQLRCPTINCLVRNPRSRMGIHTSAQMTQEQCAA